MIPETGALRAGVRLPQPLERPLHMLGTTTATVSLFMLGAVRNRYVAQDIQRTKQPLHAA